MPERVAEAGTFNRNKNMLPDALEPIIYKELENEFEKAVSTGRERKGSSSSMGQSISFDQVNNIQCAIVFYQ